MVMYRVVAPVSWVRTPPLIPEMEDLENEYDKALIVGLKYKFVARDERGVFAHDEFNATIKELAATLSDTKNPDRIEQLKTIAVAGATGQKYFPALMSDISGRAAVHSVFFHLERLGFRDVSNKDIYRLLLLMSCIHGYIDGQEKTGRYIV